MVTSPNGVQATLPTDLMVQDDESDATAVAPPPERDDAPDAPEVEPEEQPDLDPDDIEVVDDDEAEEKPAEEAETKPKAEDDPGDSMTKREWRQAVARNAIAKVRQALRGDIKPDDLNASERLLYKDMKEYRDEVEKPVRASREESVWSEYQEMWQASISDPQRFNEYWRDKGKRGRWLHMEQNRSVLGLHPGIDPLTFREKFNDYNAQFRDEGHLAGTEVDEFYEELQDKRFWADLSDEEKAQLTPARFKGTTIQVVASMAAKAALLEAEVKARKARRPVEQRVADVNGTARKAQAAARGAPLGVIRGQRTAITKSELRTAIAKGEQWAIDLETRRRLKPARSG